MSKLNVNEVVLGANLVFKRLSSQLYKLIRTDASNLPVDEIIIDSTSVRIPRLDAGPTGMIIMQTSSIAPDGFLKANGATVSLVTYGRLGIHASTSGMLATSALDKTNNPGKYYITGSNLILPDYRGMFLRAFDDGRGIDSSRGLGTDQKATALGGYIQSDLTNPPAGTYWDVALNSDGNQNIAGGIFIGNSNTSGVNGGGNNILPSDFTSTPGGYNKYETRPKNVSVLYCIKY